MNGNADRIIALYERQAQHYDTDRSRDLAVEQRWLDRFISLLPLGARVLDIGCGHGEPMARHLIEKGFDVCGVDSSPALIALCRKRFPSHDWLIADMRTLALGECFQGLLAWDSFFHLAHEDQRRMFAIFRKHAAPCAVLLFTSGPAHGERVGSYRGEPLYHASLSAAEYAHLLYANGFSVRKHLAEDPDCAFHTVWLAQMAG